MKSTKTFLNKLVTSVLYGKNQKIKISPAKMKENSSKFKEELKTYLGQIETKSLKMDYQHMMNYLYTVDTISTGGNTNTKESEKEKQEKEIQDKIRKEEKLTKSNFFNEFSLKILEETNSKELINIACKSYVGDTDIPHDPARSFLILNLAKAQSESLEETKEIQFYLDYFRKNSSTNPEEVKESCDNIFKNKESIKAKYITARDLFNIITYNMYNVTEHQILNEVEKEFFYEKIYYIMDDALRAGIYEADYILGLMYLKGLYTKQNLRKAFYHFCKSASYSHGMAYYELYKFLKEDRLVIYLENEQSIKNQAMFDYLTNSAEEGYLEAMHELGNQYISGTLRKKNNLKALAWHRQACRNGYILSYEPCGDIFYNGGFGVKRNKALSLVMYYCAYVNGIREIKEKVIRVSKELKEEGEPIPEMAMI